jgi:hypothetical protein
LTPAIQASICTFGALLFACAALQKLRSAEEFSAALGNYQLLPGSWTSPVATALPCAEILVAASLLISPLQTAGLISAATLCLVFATAVAINIGRGRRFIDCGCGGTPATRSSLHWGLVIRNLTLVAAFSWCALVRDVPHQWGMVAVGCVAGCNAYLLYAGHETLAAIANYPRPKLSAAMRDLAWRRHPETAT